MKIFNTTAILVVCIGISFASVRSFCWKKFDIEKRNENIGAILLFIRNVFYFRALDQSIVLWFRIQLLCYFIELRDSI